MTAFISRRGAGAGGRKPTVPIRVAQVYLDTRQRQLFCLNATASQMLREGIPLNGENIDPRVFRSLAGQPLQVADLPMMRAWREKKPYEASYLFTGPDDVTRYLTWSAAPLADSEGVRGILSSLVLAGLEPDWQHLAGLAHDLRTPLQALRLIIPMLEDTPLPPESRPILDRLLPCVERTLSISLSLLDWARNPTKGGRRIERQWFTLEPFLQELSDEHAVQAQDKGIGWRTDFRVAQGLSIHADRIHLGRLLSNLMSNAIRYTPRGEVNLGVSWRADAMKPNPFLVLSVEDTGTGISPEDQESIFQPFERGRAGKESDSSGSGIGLTVVDQLIDQLGLTLDVFSEYGRGSRFEILLPPECVQKS